MPRLFKLSTFGWRVGKGKENIEAERRNNTKRSWEALARQEWCLRRCAISFSMSGLSRGGRVSASASENHRETVFAGFTSKSEREENRLSDEWQRRSHHGNWEIEAKKRREDFCCWYSPRINQTSEETKGVCLSLFSHPRFAINCLRWSICLHQNPLRHSALVVGGMFTQCVMRWRRIKRCSLIEKKAALTDTLGGKKANERGRRKSFPRSTLHIIADSSFLALFQGPPGRSRRQRETSSHQFYSANCLLAFLAPLLSRINQETRNQKMSGWDSRLWVKVLARAVLTKAPTQQNFSISCSFIMCNFPWRKSF